MNTCLVVLNKQKKNKSNSLSHLLFLSVFYYLCILWDKNFKAQLKSLFLTQNSLFLSLSLTLYYIHNTHTLKQLAFPFPFTQNSLIFFYIHNTHTLKQLAFPLRNSWMYRCKCETHLFKHLKVCLEFWNFIFVCNFC